MIGTIGAVAGLLTSIPCDFSGILQEAPFWLINGTVYELFSIPRHFPFIPVVESYATLNIPSVPLSISGTTFQCARFNGSGVIRGIPVQLTVVPSMFLPLYTTDMIVCFNYRF